MHPRPFYRSRLFWLGLLGLVFLLWGWWLSMEHYSFMGFGGAPHWEVGQIRGELYAYWNSSGWPNLDYPHFEHQEMSMEEARNVRAELDLWPGMEANLCFVVIPYYWVVLACAGVWLLTLAWWQCRKSRLLKLHTAP